MTSKNLVDQEVWTTLFYRYLQYSAKHNWSQWTTMIWHFWKSMFCYKNITKLFVSRFWSFQLFSAPSKDVAYCRAVEMSSRCVTIATSRPGSPGGAGLSAVECPCTLNASWEETDPFGSEESDHILSIRLYGKLWIVLMVLTFDSANSERQS